MINLDCQRQTIQTENICFKSNFYIVLKKTEPTENRKSNVVSLPYK